MSEPFSARFFLAQQLYDRRLGRRASDAELAAAIEVSPASLSAYKNADEPPRHALIRKIAEVCGVDPGWLAYGELCAAPMVSEKSSHRTQFPDSPRDALIVPTKKKGTAG